MGTIGKLIAVVIRQNAVSSPVTRDMVCSPAALSAQIVGT